MNRRTHNFGAGPAVLPEPVLRRAREDLWDYRGTGIGIMEQSHRGPLFEEVIARAERDARELAGIPDDYHVLFLQGGASLQFSMAPMNLLAPGRTADYLITGAWSEKAAREARRVGEVREAASTRDLAYRRLPRADEIRYSAAPVYVHITTNNTIFGTQWPAEPEIPGGSFLVADASSDLFSRPIDVRRYGLIYAGAQKNLGPAGVTMVIARRDLVDQGPEHLPTMLQYRTYAGERSLYNTPPTFAVYVLGLVLQWIGEQGGLAALARRNEEKAAMLYSCLDHSRLFRAVAEPCSRSLMNVCFRAGDEETERRFLREAEAAGFSGLKGHRSVGGIRASLYNALPLTSVRALVEFMEEFERAAA